MLIATLLSLLGIGCYVYVLCVLLLTRQGAALLCAALSGCLIFGLAARASLKRGHRPLGALHGLTASLAAVLFVALLLMG